MKKLILSTCGIVLFSASSIIFACNCYHNHHHHHHHPHVYYQGDNGNMHTQKSTYQSMTYKHKNPSMTNQN